MSVLCYKFNFFEFSQKGFVYEQEPFVLFTNIKMPVFRVDAVRCYLHHAILSMLYCPILSRRIVMPVFRVDSLRCSVPCQCLLSPLAMRDVS